MSICRAVILTGVSRGLGCEMLDILLSRDVRPLIAIGRTLAPQHTQAADKEAFKTVIADLSNVEQASEIDFSSLLPSEVDEIVMISNAGTVEPICTAPMMAAADLARAFAINSIAPAVIAGRLAVAASSRNAQLRVLNISTGAAKRPLPGLGAYCASKAAAVMLLDCLATEQGFITVKHIDPGVFDTDMQQRLRSTTEAELPGRAIFLGFAAEGKLKPPRAVAIEILAKAGLV